MLKALGGNVPWAALATPMHTARVSPCLAHFAIFQLTSFPVWNLLSRISNLGMFGVKEFTAVINPPQTSIMAVGTTRLMPAFSSTSTTNDVTDETASSLSSGDVKHVMTVTLSSDVRAVDSEIAFKFLSTFKRNIENPMLLGL